MTREPSPEEPIAGKFDPGQILETISDAFVAVDREWRFTYLNKKAEQVFRMRSKRLVGRICWELFPEGTRTQGYRKLHMQLVSPDGANIALNAGLELVCNTPLSAVTQTDLVIVPALWGNPRGIIKQYPELLTWLQERHQHITDVRGRGLLLGIEFEAHVGGNGMSAQALSDAVTATALTLGLSANIVRAGASAGASTGTSGTAGARGLSSRASIQPRAGISNQRRVIAA